jgi:outer membrane lipoprotein-sorting protein
MSLAWKFAAAVLAAAGGLFTYIGPAPPAEALAFAEVAGRLHDARTLAVRQTLELPGAREPLKFRLLFKEPGLFRAEQLPGGAVMVMDQRANKTLVLDPAAKSAVLVTGKPPEDRAAPAGGVALVENLRKLADKKGEAAGKKRVGDVEAQGFRVRSPDVDLTVWADPKTKRPVLVESTARVQGKEFRSTLSDFELDPRLDDSLFKLDAPEGYKLAKRESGPEDPAEDVARLLRLYAERSGGTFPDRLDDWAAYDKQFAKAKTKWQGPADPDLVQAVQVIVRVQLFLLRAKGDYGYRPSGVKLGDKEKVLFWYRPEGAAKYRAVYGDLRVADVTADQLPEKPK